MFQLIGLTGPAGSGKDEVAKALVQVGFVQYALASPIKRALNAIFGWDMKQWEDREWKEKEIDALGFSPRRAAQTLGTEWGRTLHNDLWVALAEFTLKFYETALQGGEKFKKENPEAEGLPHYVGMVVSDVRFENEARWIRENGGAVWHIERANVAKVEAHSSEAGVRREYADIALFNSGTVAGLQRAAQILVGAE